MHDFAFHFVDVNCNKNHENTLIFKGTCTQSNGKIVTITFTGAEIDSSFPVTSDILEQLHKELINDFGYDRFDNKVAKKQLKSGIRIIWWKRAIIRPSPISQSRWKCRYQAT